ncbi:MAG TPA: TonB-dependent receptor [Ohtaekwangia sp.]
MNEFLLKGTKPVKYTLVLLLALAWCSAFAQRAVVTGTVKDTETGDVLPGVNVVIKGTTQGAVTDGEGKYTVEAGPDDVLVFSFVGFASQEIVVGNRSALDVTLSPDISSLDEIVVVGYGTQKKSVVTGAIAKVDADDLKRSKDLRIEQALQGRAAGVIVMNNSGQPGDNMTIRIRGTGTNGDPDPLFIVDGLPLEKEGMDFLNPADVESMEVLKDASAAAIYGARGANGVVLITTKKGKKGEKFSINYDGYYGVQNPWRKLDLLDSKEYIDIINEASLNDGSLPIFSQAQIDDYTQHTTDWQKEMLNESAPKTSHTLSFNGGGENSTYSSSLNYYSQDGIVGEGKSNFERITYRLNTSYTFKKFTLGSNLNLVNIKTRGIDGNSPFGTGIAQALNMPPMVPVKLPDGTWGTPNMYGVGLQEISNPVALLSYLNRKTTTNKVLGNIYGELEIIKGLKLRTNYSAEVSFVKRDEYMPMYNLDPTHQRLVNSVEKDIHQYNRWNWDNTLSYERTMGKHQATALVGFTHFKEWDENLFAQRDSIVFNDLDHAYLDNSLKPTGRSNNALTEHALQSFFSRINYNYDEKYMFEAVLRVDGSSRFGRENRYGYFPAFSGGWVASREDFFPQNEILDFVKLRASWGQNGNENIGNFKYTSIMQRGLNYFFGDGQILNVGVQPDFYPNPIIKWETSQQMDIGLDLAFLNSRLSLSVDYYDKRTKDWLIDNAPFPLLIGNNGPTINAGEVKNSGIEIEAGFKEQLSNGLFMDLKLTASTNKSEVLAIENATGNFTGGQGSVGQSSILRAEVGQPLGYFWGYVTEGIFQNEEELAAYPHQPNAVPGDFKFRDRNGDGELDDDDRDKVGTPYPKLILGLNASFEWKGFDLGMFWYSALGHQIYTANRRNDLAYANYTTEIFDRWYGEGTSNTIPRVTLADLNGSWKRASDFYVKDADFVRLKNITLGYTIPNTLAGKIGLTRVRVYITSENPLTFTKYEGMEVEVGGGGPLDLGIDKGVYPQSKTFLGGINITF